MNTDQIKTWNETEPPQDGTPIVACGGVMVHDDYSVSKIPFCAPIYWSAEHSDWLRWGDGLSVRRALDEEVIIHYWMPYPLAQPGDRPAHHYQFEEA